MPELPDLEVIREYLSPRMVGVAILSADVLRPLIVRNLLGGAPADHLAGHRVEDVTRRGKQLILHIEGGPKLVVQPMLAGRIRYGAPLKKDRARDAFVLHMEDGTELRYHDAKDMGKIYLLRDPAHAPGLNEIGPEADDPALTIEAFRERLRKHSGEMKRILTNQAFVAGIGNAYADEILWCARVFPMRRRASLNADEVAALHRCMQAVLAKAIERLRERVGDDIDVEVRDFLAVHGKAGEECPRCGGRISEVVHERSATCFCRACQPGLMVAKGRQL